MYTSSSSKKSKNKSLIIWGSVIFLLIVILLGGCTSYNGMVTADEKVTQSWADVQASYQRRFDLIPNLVETVKGYAAHESGTLEIVTALRTQGDSLMSAVHNQAPPGSGTGTSIEHMEALNRQMLLYINAVHEAYPNLRASENFKRLQNEFESAENRINTERNQYNFAVSQYNELVKKLPNNKYEFQPKELLKPSQEAQSIPTVKF